MDGYDIYDRLSIDGEDVCRQHQCLGLHAGRINIELRFVNLQRFSGEKGRSEILK